LARASGRGGRSKVRSSRDCPKKNPFRPGREGFFNSEDLFSRPAPEGIMKKKKRRTR
jgi:hypothetical protein